MQIIQQSAESEKRRKTTVRQKDESIQVPSRSEYVQVNSPKSSHETLMFRALILCIGHF